MLVGYRATALPLDKAEIKLVANVQEGFGKSSCFYAEHLSLIFAEPQKQRDVKKLVADNFHPSAADYTTKAQITRDYDDFLAYGNYFTQLQPFLKEFSLENFHFMDGTRMATIDAVDEARKFEEFLGVESDLDFERNAEKGFMCLSKPVEFCLSGAKGRKSTLDYKVCIP